MGKKCAVTTNRKKSAEAIVLEKKPGRAEQSLVLSRFRKEVNMKKAEYQGNLSCPQRDSAEHEGYVGAQSVGGQEGKEQDGAACLQSEILSFWALR